MTADSCAISERDQRYRPFLSPHGMSSLRNLLHSTYKSAAEAVLPARTQSAFKEKGVSARKLFAPS